MGTEDDGFLWPSVIDLEARSRIGADEDVLADDDVAAEDGGGIDEGGVVHDRQVASGVATNQGKSFLWMG